MKESYKALFKDIFDSDEYKLLKENLIKETNNKVFYPEAKNIFRCFNYHELDELKTLIISQDPYHTPGAATGLAFACSTNQPSLQNIKKELGVETIDFEDWAKQGVLLLNRSLTVEKGKPNSHKHIWDWFTLSLIKKILEYKKDLYILAWGRDAISAFTKYEDIILKNNHVVIKTTHPSPFSAYKPAKEIPAFLGSGCFDKVKNITWKPLVTMETCELCDQQVKKEEMEVLEGTDKKYCRACLDSALQRQKQTQ